MVKGNVRHVVPFKYGRAVNLIYRVFGTMHLFFFSIYFLTLQYLKISEEVFRMLFVEKSIAMYFINFSNFLF